MASFRFARFIIILGPLKGLIGEIEPFKGINYGNRAVNFHMLISKFWPLDARICDFGLEIRILCEISSLETAPKV